MVTLTISSALHIAYVNASGSTWPKSYAAPHLNHKEWNGAIDNAISIMWQ